ncbi:hypothetical protein FZ042_15480, partial [Listeria monocytogenes]|uniref:condensation domain-containing protein n=1 Tax=Listeria monocytogenes TaxID=1639 RepID=UPI0011EB5135
GEVVGQEEWVPYGTGEGISENNRMPGKLQVNGIVTNGCLTMSFSYDDQWVTEAEAESLKKNFQQHLEAIIIHSVQQEKVVKTPSDFSYKDLTMDQLKELTSDEAIEDILPLTPMQAGMFYHYKKDIKTTSYVVQNEFFVPKHIDDMQFLKALEMLQEKHVALKITLNDEIVDIPLQLIWKNKMIEFERINSEVSWRKTMAADILEGFDLRKGPLFRVKVQKHENNTRMLISFHHIILDGWSTGLVYNDLMYFYNKLNEGTCPKKLGDETLESNTESFQEYIRWLSKQNKEECLSFWNKVLHGYENIAKISPISKDRGIKESFVEETLSLDSEKVSHLINNLENLGVTLNTFVEVAWGIILQQYNRIDDVVFGKVVSGRNIPVKNIENAVGLFINSVPVRIENKNENVSTLLQKHQKVNNESEKFHYCALTDILSETKMKINFIETIMSFENYHVDSISEKLSMSKTWERKLTNEATNYDVSLNSRLYDNMLEFECSYNKAKYQDYEIKGMLRQFESIVSEYIINPERKISSFSRYNELSKPIISNVSSKSQIPRATFKELFELIVKTYPENKAIIAGNQL